jgi:hypothetical protein
VCFVDPLAGQIGEGGKVLGSAQPLRLEAAVWLAEAAEPVIAGYPAHRLIAGQPLGVVHVLVAGQPPEHLLAQQASRPVATVLVGARIDQRIGPLSVRPSASSNSR